MGWRGRERNSAGQSMVEFALVIPVMMVLLLGAVEMGFAINHNTSIETATRQGARVGSQLVNGGGTLGCGAGQSPDAASVDPQIIAAVEGALVSPGSPVKPDQIQEIDIFLSNASGQMTAGAVNRWVYAEGGGPVVSGVALDFKQSTGSWQACSRSGNFPAQSIGVRIVYTYRFITPIGAFADALGGQQIVMTDATVMAMEPPTP